MNNKPTVFIIYLAGSFGNFIANLFYGKQIQIKGDVDQRNAHLSKKKEYTFNAFRKHPNNLTPKDKKSFKTQQSQFGIHTLPFYHWLNFDFDLYFNNYKKIIVQPAENEIEIIGKRLYDVFLKHPNDLLEKGIKDIVLKNLNLPNKEYPEYFLDQLCIKDTVKNLQKDYKNLQDYKPNDRDIVLPYSKIKDKIFLESTITSIVDKLGIEYSGFPEPAATAFLSKNQEYFIDNREQLN